jgi:hypothetical protein
MLGLCLTVMFVTAAIAATTASAALPEWGGCEYTPHGKYRNSTCTEALKGKERKSEGAYEWYTGASFGWLHHRETGKGAEGISTYRFGETSGVTHNIAASTFELSSGKKMTCASGHIFFSLENANPKNVRRVLLALVGCESEGQLCESNFALEAGEVSNEDEWVEGRGLKGYLGFIDEPKQEVGLFITAFDTKSEHIEERQLLFAACTAGGLESVRNLEIGGDKKGGNGIIGVLTPVNTMTTEYGLTYTQEKGIQTPSAFEGKTGGLQGNEEGVWQPLGFSAPPILLRPEERFEAEFWKVQAPIEIKTEP